MGKWAIINHKVQPQNAQLSSQSFWVLDSVPYLAIMLQVILVSRSSGQMNLIKLFFSTNEDIISAKIPNVIFPSTFSYEIGRKWSNVLEFSSFGIPLPSFAPWQRYQVQFPHDFQEPPRVFTKRFTGTSLRPCMEFRWGLVLKQL